MGLRTVLYVVACMVVPPLWGLVASAVYDRFEARRRLAEKAAHQAADRAGEE